MAVGTHLWIFDWAMLNGGCEKRRKGLHFPAFCVKVSLHD